MGNEKTENNTETVKQLTKTDARDLKSLVRSDTKILQSTLEQRYRQMDTQLGQEVRRREGENKKVAQKELAALVKRVNTLNEAIVKRLKELSDEGWMQQEYRKVVPIQPSKFTVSFQVKDLVPPDSVESQLTEAYESLTQQYWDAKRAVEVREGEMIRELTLMSVTSDTAREFILDMPTPESLLPTPQILQQLDVGDSNTNA
jgi:hypothetical protein